MVRLATLDRTFVPDVIFKTADGNISNRKLGDGEQVTVEVTLADPTQKGKWMGGYTVSDRKSIKRGEVKSYTNFKYKECIAFHAVKIENLEDTDGKPVTTGKELVAIKNPQPGITDMIQEIFSKVNGFHADDSVDENDDLPVSDSGELSSGE